MKVLVTGGAGYVGVTTVRSLLAHGYEVVVYDNLSTGHREAIPGEVSFIVGDVADRDLLDATLREHRPAAVLHFAGVIEAGESMHSPEKYFRNNSVATLTLLEAMLANAVDKLVFSSTAALYGEPEHLPIEETNALQPTNAYGESKLLVERMLHWFAYAHGLRYASLRYFNAAGSDGKSGECRNPESHLIPLVLQAAAGQRDHVNIYGTDYPTRDGTCIRDYIHVSDLAEAHVSALHALPEHERLVYNLGTGNGFSVREVIECARRVTGRKFIVIETGRRPGDPAVLIASSHKIQEELGWSPQRSALESILSSAWEWMQQHPAGYSRRPQWITYQDKSRLPVTAENGNPVTPISSLL